MNLEILFDKGDSLMVKNNRVLVLSNSWAGLHSFRKEVILAFREQGYDVFVSCPKDNPEKSKWFEEIECRLIPRDFNRQGTNPVADFKLMLFYRKLIKHIKPLAVLTYTIKPNLYGGMACALCGVPQIANVTGLGAAVEYPGFMQKMTIMLYKIGLHKTYLTFFQNEENRQFCLRHKMVKGKTKLIPGSGVNLSYHQFITYPLQIEPIRFVFCGRIRKEKGIEEYLATAEAMHKKYGEKVEFQVLGECEGDYDNRLKQLSARQVIKYYGRQADVRPFFAKAWCTIHPTFYPEGMSNVLLESCAAGRPIITTNRAGCREIVDDCVNGFIVNQQDSNDLINKVDNFIKLPYAQKVEMGKFARKKVEAEFDRTIVVDAYLQVVADIQAHNV